MTPTDRAHDLPPASDLLLRPATDDDLDAVVGVHLSAREDAAARGVMPPGVHPEHEARAWLDGRLATDEVWVAERDGDVVGYARITPGWLDDLYVLPGHAGQGVGSALLELVRARQPEGFSLWVFEANLPARRFYARHGLVELERTDGSANEERQPDVRMAWPGAAPLTYLRGLIDDVDEQLGDLLARRVALTRAVQDHKRTHPDGDARDPEREARIAAAVAARAPELGPERAARIVHAIITESLDAVRER